MNSTKWRKIITCILALTLLAGCSVSDSLGITTHSAQDVEIPAADQERFSMLFHDEYVDQFQLDVEKFSQREQALQRGYALVNSEESESLERGKNLFTGFCYSITSRGSTLQYFGELKNNKPDGFGVIYDNSMSYYTYIGNFSKGKFSGYGIQFSDKLNDNGNVDYAVQQGEISPELATKLSDYFDHYVTYEGEWKNGAKSGRGNEFTLTSESGYPELKNYWAGSYYPVIYSGQFSKDQYNGTGRLFEYGRLTYEGSCKKSHPNGEGTKYYSNGQVQYEGHWKNGKYDGSGTAYNEDGSVAYSGKWRNGDYA